MSGGCRHKPLRGSENTGGVASEGVSARDGRSPVGNKGATGPGRWRAAVLGSPIGHSLSPVLHRAAYAELGLTTWRYEAFECTEQALRGFVQGLGPEWAGLSLTMPLKRVVLGVADEICPLARAIGAANTLVLGARRRAVNTDVTGIRTALCEAGLERVRAAVVLGAGGTAQAALAALRDLGQSAPTVVVRDRTRAAALCAAADRLAVTPTICGGFPDVDLPEADVVISTLPAGAADRLRPQRWSPDTLVLDVVYASWPTPLAVAASEAGCPIVSGLAVLLHQAAAQVELMTGHRAPVDRMRQALEAAGRSPA